MKMKNILKVGLMTLALAALTTGCIKETLPEGGSAVKDQISESPFATGGVISSVPAIFVSNNLGTDFHIDFGYPTFGIALDHLTGTMFSTAEAVHGNSAYDRYYMYDYVEYGWLGADSDATTLFYLNYYQFIYTINEAISLLPEDNPEHAVARAFRAMCYLDMARLYDPLPANAPNDPSYEVDRAKVDGLTVPIVTDESLFEQLSNNPRVPREELFALIFDDLKAAEEGMQNYVPASKNLPSLAAVYGLYARAYLWLGGFSEQYEGIPTGEAAYKLAAEYARKAIDKSGAPITTEAQWLDPKTGFNTTIASWLWAMVQSTDTVLGNLHSFTAHASPDAMWGYGPLAMPGMSIFDYNRMASNDFRKKNIVNPEGSYAAIAPYINLTEEEFSTAGMDGNGNPVSIAPMTWFKFHPNQGEKYTHAVGNVTDIPLMRIEEMYLIEAEATAHYDAGTGKSLLESFMANRAPGYKCPAAASSGDALVDEIIFQKRMEFWAEGICFYDMKRLNMSMHNGDAGTNAPGGARYTTNGRAPWWNIVIPLSAVQQNVGLKDHNNPEPTVTVKVSK